LRRVWCDIAFRSSGLAWAHQLAVHGRDYLSSTLRGAGRATAGPFQRLPVHSPATLHTCDMAATAPGTVALDWLVTLVDHGGVSRRGRSNQVFRRVANSVAGPTFGRPHAPHAKAGGVWSSYAEHRIFKQKGPHRESRISRTHKEGPQLPQDAPLADG
jgi:hypothetical protein